MVTVARTRLVSLGFIITETGSCMYPRLASDLCQSSCSSLHHTQQAFTPEAFGVVSSGFPQKSVFRKYILKVLWSYLQEHEACGLGRAGNETGIVVMKVKCPHRVLRRWEVLSELACFKSGTLGLSYPAVFNESLAISCFQETAPT